MIDLDIESSGLHNILGINIADEKSLSTFLLPQNRKLSNIENYVHKIGSFGKNSEVFLIPTITSATPLKEIHWDKAEDVFLRDKVIPTFRDVYNLDYLLLDSRTGVSRLSVSALSLSDLTVLFCRLDKQNQNTYPKVMKICHSAGVPIITVASSVPTVKDYQNKITAFEKKVESKIEVVLPYMSDLYFNETIVSQKSPQSPLAKAYFKLVEKIIDDVQNDD